MATITASGIGELLTGGRTADSYILKRAMEGIGIREELSTYAMRHGTISQHEAFRLLLSDKAVWHDTYTPIDERCGASADAIGEQTCYDVKCPYYIDTFLEQKAKLPKKYYSQVQMQMIAEKKDFGAVLIYLTSPEMDMYGNTIEYPFPLEYRYFMHEFKTDEEVQYNIMQSVDKYYPTLVDYENRLREIGEGDKEEFFYKQFRGEVTYRKLKTASNFDKAIDKAIRIENEFYYQIS